MIVGIGVDIADNARFESLGEGFLKRIFTPLEISEGELRAKKGEFFASRFASKEAFSKALGTGLVGLSPREIEIIEDEKGKPSIRLLKALDKEYKIHLSLSHEKEMSIAMVVIEDGKN